MISLITGGAGFIGSHLAEKLIEKKQLVYIIDDLSTGNLDNLANIKNSPYLHFYKGGVLDENLIKSLTDKVQNIYHLAASVGVKLVLESPIRTIENNVRGTENILKYASLEKKRVLLTSTSEVYGKSSKKSFSEDDDLVQGPTSKTRWSYAASKILDEHLALAYFQEKNLPVTIARLFNTVGERQTGRYGMVVPRFINQALKNEDITIYGDGDQSRCFCYIGDVVWALQKLMDHPKAVGEIFNVGSTESISINNLADRVIKLTESRSKKVYIPYDKAYGEGFEETMHRMPDIKKILKLIDFRPKYDLDTIIIKIKDYFISQ